MQILSTEVLDNSVVVRTMQGIPLHIRGFVRYSCDGWANIYINIGLSLAERKKVYEHEMRHINNNDFYNDKTIYEIERGG